MPSTNPQTASRTTATQRCIEPSCAARFELNERIYVCPHCGGLLDVVQELTTDPEQLQTLWTRRLASFEARDRSGVWRYRELLPFADDAPIVSLAEGNTHLRRSSFRDYCGLQALAKHKGLSDGSFKTGNAVATRSPSSWVYKRRLRQHCNTAASLAAMRHAQNACAICVAWPNHHSKRARFGLRCGGL